MKSETPHIALARGPPLWDDCGDALAGEGTQIGPHCAISWDVAVQPAPDFDVDQRINWSVSKAAISAATG